MSKRDNLIQLMADAVEEYLEIQGLSNMTKEDLLELQSWRRLADQMEITTPAHGVDRISWYKRMLTNAEKKNVTAENQLNTLKRQLKASDDRCDDLESELNDQAKMIQDIREMLG